MGLISRVSSRTYRSPWQNLKKPPKMGIDLNHKKDRKAVRKGTKSDDLYLNMLVKLYRLATKQKDGKTSVVIGTITNDIRLHQVPKNMDIADLRVTEAARKRITAAGGKIRTLDELAQDAPLGQNTVLLQGPRSHREAIRHFGAPGVPKSHAKPYV